MSKNKPSTFGVGFVAKGEAKSVDATKPIPVSPTIRSEVVSPVQPVTELPIQEKPVISEKLMPAQPMATKSITVKVDLPTYKKLKSHGLEFGNKTNQDIFTEALAMYFKAYRL